MDLSVLLPRHHILLHLAAETRRDILGSLVSPLVDDGLVSDREVLLRDLERREDEITTQIGHRVAFPHARSHAASRLALTVAIADEPGLVFNRQSAEGCRLFFLIAVPAFAPTAHLPLLQRLANFAHDDKRMARLLASGTAAQAVRFLVGYKG